MKIITNDTASFELLPLGHQFSSPEEAMRYALQLATLGIGKVEPNPPVGAVIVDDRMRLQGQGWHQEFGGPHAEIHAIQQARESRRGDTLFVTLEPCCHTGKTPPCINAILRSGLRRVYAAQVDPFPEVAGQGIQQLRQARLDVQIGLLESEARDLLRPYLMLLEQRRPYVHAKWAMSWDGKIATHTGSSQWITSEASRQLAHQLRGRMDGILVGVGTVRKDDPLLTARPAGPRRALRIVLDPSASTPPDCQLLRTLDDGPVLIAVTSRADADRVQVLEERGAEVLAVGGVASSDGVERLDLGSLLSELGRRRLTNLLVEGGAATLGHFFDAQLIDEVHLFMGAKMIGGQEAPSPIRGMGISQIDHVPELDQVQCRIVGSDLYLQGRVSRRTPAPRAEVLAKPVVTEPVVGVPAAEPAAEPSVTQESESVSDSTLEPTP